jgi:hypothetical protein
LRGQAFFYCIIYHSIINKLNKVIIK